MELESENNKSVGFQNLPSHILWKIFDCISITELKTFSLVCWQWYHEIAMAWRHRIQIYLPNSLQGICDPHDKKFRNNMACSNRYYENIIIKHGSRYTNSSSVSYIIELIELIKSQRSITYTNSFKSLSLIFYDDTSRFIDIVSTLGNKLMSLELEFSFSDEIEISASQMNSLKKAFTNVQTLNLTDSQQPKCLNLCYLFNNLRSLIMNIVREDDLMNLVIFLQNNPNIRELKLNFICSLSKGFDTELPSSFDSLVSLEIDGEGEIVNNFRKYFVTKKINSLRCFIGNSCDFNDIDFRAMQINWPYLEKLDLELKLKSESNTLNTCMIYNYCWNMLYLKELRINNVYSTNNENQENILMTFPLIINESLINVCYQNQEFENALLKRTIQSTPNISKLVFKNIVLDFDVDSLLLPLSKLSFLEILVLENIKWKGSQKNKRLPKMNLNKLKEIHVHNIESTDKVYSTICETTRLFRALGAITLKKIVILDIDKTKKKLLNFIPTQYPQLQILDITSLDLLPEHCFRDVAKNYEQIREFRFKLRTNSSMNLIETTSRIISDVETFQRNTKFLKYAEFTYYSDSGMRCSSRCWNCHECLQFQLKRFCNKVEPPLHFAMRVFRGLNHRHWSSQIAMSGDGKIFKFNVGFFH